jgi:hypothetical protein
MPISSANMRASTSPFLRLLVLGPPKIGKTRTCIVTAPGPVYVINSDDTEALPDGGALAPAASVPEAVFSSDVVPGTDLQAMQKALAEAKRGAKAGEYKTVVWDTITLFASRLKDLCESHATTKGGEVDGRKMWPAYHENLRRILDSLFAIPAHVIVTAHLYEKPAGEGRTGDALLPHVAGQSQSMVPARFQDVVLLAWDKQERVFFTHLKGVYGLGSRSLPGVEKVPADIGKLLEAIQERKAALGAK